MRIVAGPVIASHIYHPLRLPTGHILYLMELAVADQTAGYWNGELPLIRDASNQPMVFA